MADQKISALTELTAPDAADEFIIVDKSDTSMAATGTDKRIKVQTLVASQGTWFAVEMIALGAPVTGAPGADTAGYAAVKIPPNTPALTGIVYSVGTTSNGNVRSALYDSTGARVANRSSALAQGTTSTQQQVPFDSPYTPPVSGGLFYTCLILSSATGTWFRGGSFVPAGSVAGPGSGATPTSITPPTATGTIPRMSTY